MTYRFGMFVCLCWLAGLSAHAQYELTLPLLTDLAQAAALNPAAVPEHRWQVGVPGLSVHAHFAHTGFTLNQALERGPRADTLLADRALDRLGRRNRLDAGAAVELLSVRGRIGSVFMGVHITERIFGRLTYDDDLLRVLWRGNGDRLGQEITFDRAGLFGQHLREYALSVTYPGEGFSLGLRPKLFYGKASLHTTGQRATWLTPEDLAFSDLRTDYAFYTSLPDQVDRDYLMNRENWGLGVDIGATYALSRRVNVSASLRDLGYVRWRTNAEQYVLADTTRAEGLFFNFFGDTSDRVDDYLDSLAQIFEPARRAESYRSGLPTRSYLMAEYQTGPRTWASAVLLTEYFRGVRAAMALNVRHRVSRLFTGTLTYSVQNRKLVNLGGGFIFKPGPLQFFFVTDNFVGLLLPASAMHFDVRFGMNLVFDRDPAKYRDRGRKFRRY